ncbi:restriction endonuclease subunit S [Photobacterium iliopiscarium]|uniref:restriction endonuclease subunit S n=1 Tax=Photobacterium iliopiscarium TaxID=56192 RepID=UPI00069817CD|nr:restriction endonuclease subunit S [Photobacterium iliopiscarium]
MNNQLPDGWKIKTLDEICSWIGVGIATSTTHAYTESGIPILRNQNILQNSIRDSDMLNITKEFSNENQSKMLREGDIVTIRTGYPGISAVIPRKYDGCHSFTTLISRPQKEIVNSYYLSILINSDYGRTFVLGGQAGGAQQNLNVSVLKQFPVVLPPLPEQQKIAVIFTSVDDVIEKTQAQVNKLKGLKKGMMQELLTRGVGVDGKPHTEFKDSPVGRIPKGWDVVRFKDIFHDYKYGPRFSSKDYDPFGNVKTIRGTDLSSNGVIKYEQVPIAKLDKELVEKNSLQDGDLVMITTADCGATAVFCDQSIPYIASAYAIKLTPKKGLNSKYINYYMQTSEALKQVEGYIRKGTVANLPGSDVMEIELSLPHLNEQNKIVSILENIDFQIELKLLNINQKKIDKKKPSCKIY